MFRHKDTPEWIQKTQLKFQLMNLIMPEIEKYIVREVKRRLKDKKR